MTLQIPISPNYQVAIVLKGFILESTDKNLE